MVDRKAQKRILEMVQNGQIKPAEALRLLHAMAGDGQPASPPLDPPLVVNTAPVRDEWIDRQAHPSKYAWMIPFWLAVGLTIGAAFLVYWAFWVGGYSFWFFAAWILFALGLLGMVVGWLLQSAPWLHVRISNRQDDFKNVTLSFPFPVVVGIWFLRTFNWAIPQLHGVPIDELTTALEAEFKPSEPIIIQTEESQGDRVEIYIR